MITTTLTRIRTHGPCPDGWAKLLTGLGKIDADDAVLPYSTILRINGLADALWAMRCEPQHDREWRLFAVACARRVQHLMLDPRSVAALDVAERYARGEATASTLRAAWAAAWDAAWDATRDATRAAARDAAGAAAGNAAGDAAGATSWAAARAAAGAAAGDAAGAATRDAARAAARDAAGAAELAWQSAEFLRVVGE